MNNIIENPSSKYCHVVNIKNQKYDIYIGRGSKWGNPFKMKNNSKEERNRVCDNYEKYFFSTKLPFDIHELHGKILGCFCKPERCHVDFLAKLANEGICSYCKEFKNQEGWECLKGCYIQNCFEYKNK